MAKNLFVEKAVAVARASGADLAEFAANNEWQGVACGPVGQHRDSDAMVRSNFRIILKDMQKRLPEGTVEVAYFRHWAVGWIEEIFFNPIPEALAIAQEWQDRLSDYPIADDDDFSNLEWDDNHPEGDKYCYSEESDCGCDRPNVNNPSEGDGDADAE